MSAESAAHLLRLEQQQAEIKTAIDKLIVIVGGLATTPAALAAKPSLGVTVAEAMVIARRDSRTAFYRWAKKHRLKPYAAGRYRRSDVENAMARAAYVDLGKMEARR